MTRPQEVAEHIRQLIREQRMQPGDPMPSERVLSRQFGAPYGTIRQANELLVQEGLITRIHGQGTFISQTLPAAMTGLQRRLGLMYVDPIGYLRGHSPTLIQTAQRCTQKRGYELVIESLVSEELFAGRLPEIVSRRSVDAVLLDGWVTNAHLRFLDQHALPYVVMGLRDFDRDVPQVQPNIYGLLRRMTGHLIEQGFESIFLDADPAFTEYRLGVEMFRGYRDEMTARRGGAAPLHLCRIEPDRVRELVDQLADKDLSNVAMLVQSPSWPLLAEALIQKNPSASKMLFVPMPLPRSVQPSLRANHLHWRTLEDSTLLVELAVNGLIDAMEDPQITFQSARIDALVELFPGQHHPSGFLTRKASFFGPHFRLTRHAGGAHWQSEPTPALNPSPTAHAHVENSMLSMVTE